MAQIIAPGVARFTISGTTGSGGTWANIWDARLLGGVEDDRAEACRNYAGWMLQTWDSTIATRVSDSITAQQVAWVDLDSATGSTGATTTGWTVAGPFTGAVTSAVAPSNVAGLCVKNVTAARGSRNGRWYQIGYPEGQINVDVFTGADLSAIQTTYTNFLTAMTDPALDVPFSFLPCVVHTRNEGTPTNPDIVYAGNDVIQAMTFQAKVATQRRRLRR